MIKRRHIYSEQLTELANLYFRISELTDPFLEQNRRLATLGSGLFQDAQRRSVSRLAPAQQRDLHRPITGREPLGTLESSHADPADGGSSWIRISASASILEQRIPGSQWSHGDAGMANVIYDEKSDRARLIDFEIVHDKSLPALSRHADDLLIFLLDLIAMRPDRQWLPFTLASSTHTITHL